MNTSGAAKKKAAVAGNYYQIMVAAGATSKEMANIEQVHWHDSASGPFLPLHSPRQQASSVDFGNSFAVCTR